MRDESIRVRPATERDVPLILALIRELAEYERAPNDVVATEDALRCHLFGPWDATNARPGPAAECLIGECDGRAEGFALYFSNFSTWMGRPGLYLEDLFVRPSARGRGLGRALLRRLARVAVERGCGRMEWAVLDWNQPAIGFYRALGATPMDEWTVFRLTGPALRALADEARPAT
ncbi:MAG: GNAT family N-acetyltransferase [Phycisphaerae bacterium]|nr:GNAT family N-acetyltransferase [Phycisphaerae bacterium]